jgi:hypothetical protein
MKDLGLIYDISADMFAVVDNRCFVNPPNILMLLANTDDKSKAYLSSVYGIHIREKYDLGQLYYLICEILSHTLSSAKDDTTYGPEEIIKQIRFKDGSKNTIDNMLAGTITIDQVNAIECIDNRGTNSDKNFSVKVTGVGQGQINNLLNNTTNIDQPIDKPKQPSRAYDESIVEEVYHQNHQLMNHKKKESQIKNHSIEFKHTQPTQIASPNSNKNDRPESTRRRSSSKLQAMGKNRARSMYIHIPLIHKVAVDMCSFIELTNQLIEASEKRILSLTKFSYLSDRMLSILLCQAFRNQRMYLNSIEDKNNLFKIDDFDQFVENKENTLKVMNDLTTQKNELQTKILERKQQLLKGGLTNDELTTYTHQLMQRVFTNSPPIQPQEIENNLQILLKDLISISRNHYLDMNPVIKEQHPKIIIISTNIFRLVNRDRFFPLDSETFVFDWPAFNKQKYDHTACMHDFNLAIKQYLK